MLTCTRNGCKRQFSAAENRDDACVHHPGAPEFHEGRKGWTCCAKRVDDFDAFLQIPGCARAQHTDVAPAVAAQPVEAPPKDEPAETPVKDKEAPPPPRPETQVASTVAGQDAPVDELALNDDPAATVSKGAKCLRAGCGAEFTGPDSRNEPCAFHRGAAVFHEGSKGWSCCPRRVLEFDEFLKIGGCTAAARHRFLAASSATALPEKTVREPSTSVRHDWYQTQTAVILSLFVKKADEARSHVRFEPWAVHCDIVLLATPADAAGPDYVFAVPLAQPIDPARSTVKVLGSKLELTLAKANGISWPSLEPPKDGEAPRSWTTFGTTGFVGTVGAKEAIVSTDAPLYASSGAPGRATATQKR